MTWKQLALEILGKKPELIEVQPTREEIEKAKRLASEGEDLEMSSQRDQAIHDATYGRRK